MHTRDVIRGSRLARPEPHVRRDKQVVVRDDAYERARDAVAAFDHTKARQIVDGQRRYRRCELVDGDVQIEDEEPHESTERPVLFELTDLHRYARRAGDDLVAGSEGVADLLRGEADSHESVAQTPNEIGLVEWKWSGHWARC